jgi:hypothetical protein
MEYILPFRETTYFNVIFQYKKESTIFIPISVIATIGL